MDTVTQRLNPGSMPWLTVKWKIKVIANSGKLVWDEFPGQLVISILLP